MAINESGSGFSTGPDTSSWSSHSGDQDEAALNQTEQSKIHQDQIQAACLLTIKLTERAKQPDSRADHAFLERNLNELIQCQQDLENELGRLHGTQDLTHLWWQAAELETLIYGLHLVLTASRPLPPEPFVSGAADIKAGPETSSDTCVPKS